MSVQAVPHIRTVRRLNRSASKVRVKEEGVQLKVDDEEKENRNNRHKEGKENRSKILGPKKETRSKLKLEDKNKTNTQTCTRNEMIEEMTKSAANDDSNGQPCHNLDFDAMFCHHCDESLLGHRYAVMEDQTYCIKCYDSIFANICNECHKIIDIDSEDLFYKGKHRHSSCFSCTMCKNSVVDKPFGSNSDSIYCGPCYDSNFGSKCSACGDVFKIGMKTIESKGKLWHEDCFVCSRCKCKIRSKTVVPDGKDIFCENCYEDSHSAKCISCCKAVISEGLTYQNQPWHMHCFTCTHCKQSLPDANFTSRADKPYCYKCVGQLFGKQCFACTKHISGTDGKRFLSFNGCHWHSSCFCCTVCSMSLVDKGFILEEDHILCSDCALSKDADVVLL